MVGLRVPKRLIIFSILVSLGAQLCWPFLGVVPVWPTTLPWLQSVTSPWSRLITPLAGLAAGAMLGWMVELLSAAKTMSGSYLTGDVSKTLAIVGVFLGWQGVVLATLLAAIIHLLASCFVRRESLWACWILLGVCIMLCAWRPISTALWLPGAESDLLVHSYWTIATLLLLLCTEEFAPRKHETAVSDAIDLLANG